jgi:YesN/AraC family two-component response regulator
LAKDGKQAMEKFREQKPQAVVMDIRMPLMDGIETLNAMLGRDRQIPIILNTGFPEYKQNYMTWGAEAFLVKSSDLSELKQKIREVLEKREKLGKSSSAASRNNRKKSRPRPLLEERMGGF